MDSDTQVVFFLANRDFRDEEYTGVKDVLDQSSISSKVAAIEPGECTGISGTEAEVELTVDEVNPEQFNGIVFIGGTGAEQFLNDQSVQGLAKSFLATGKIVAAICWAPAMLARAGILNGKKATVWSGAKEDLEKGEAQYTGEAVTVDGNIITGNGPDAAVAFGQAIAKAIAG